MLPLSHTEGLEIWHSDRVIGASHADDVVMTISYQARDSGKVQAFALILLAY